MKKNLYVFFGIISILLFQENLFCQDTYHITFIQNQTINTLNSSDVDVGDLNGDGYTDAFITMFDEKGNCVLINDMYGKLIDNGQRLGALKGCSVALGDLDNDNDLDAFICNVHSEVDKNGQPNTVWFNDGTGKFTDSDQRLGNSASVDVKLIDLDDDGDLDAIVANLHHYDTLTVGQPNEIWINNGSGIFTLSQLLGNKITGCVDAADMNNDGYIDLFFGTNFGDDLSDELWFGSDSGYYPESKKIFAKNYRTGSCKIDDLNEDNISDIFITEREIPFRIWFNDGEGNFTENNNLSNDYSGGGDLGDLDNDGDIDVFIAKGTYSEARINKIYLNNGNGVFSDSTIDVGKNKSSDVKLTDFDNDGDLDAYVVNILTDDIIWFNTPVNQTNININRNDAIKIYPNPSGTFIKVETDKSILDQINYQLFDLNGSLVKRGMVVSDIINISDFNSSIYILHLDINGQLLNRKIIKD